MVGTGPHHSPLPCFLLLPGLCDGVAKPARGVLGLCAAPWPLDRTKAVGRGGMKPLLPQSEWDPQAIRPALQYTSPLRQHP